MNETETRLKKTIGDLYAIFARYSRPGSLMTDLALLSATDSPLLSSPLREISGDEIGYYAAKALTTWGNADEYRYFLPRILDLATRPKEQARWVNLEIIIGKLDYGHWRDWSQDEQRVIESFLAAWWRKTVNTYSDAWEAPSVLRSIARVTAIEPHIQMLRLAAQECLEGRRILAALVCENWHVHDLMLKRCPPWHEAAWWDEVPGRYLTLLEYLFGDDAATCLMQPFIVDDLESKPYDAEYTRDHVEWYQKARTAILAYVSDSRSRLPSSAEPGSVRDHDR